MITQKGCFDASFLLADIKGLNVLATDELLSVFVEKVYPSLTEIMNVYAPLSANLWGNTVIIAFADPLPAALCALDFRDLFKRFDWERVRLQPLQIQVSLHAGRAFHTPEPAVGNGGFICPQIHLATRLAPVLRTGEVWTSDAFTELLKTASPDSIIAENLGVKPLAQNWGGQEIHRLRRAVDPPLDDDNIYERGERRRVDPVAILLTLFERGDDEQRCNTVRMLGRADDPRALEKLCAIVRDGNFSLYLRLDAVTSLGVMKNSCALPTLAHILSFEEREDPRLQIACLKAMLSIDASATGSAILGLLSHIENYQEAVVKKAIHSLIVIKDAAAIDFVKEMIRKNQLKGQLLKTALQMFTVLDDYHVSPSAVRLLGQETPHDMRLCALTYLVYCHPQALSCTDLDRIIHDPVQPFDLRLLALAGLAAIDSNETRVALAEIAEAAGKLSSYAAQFLIEGKEMVEQLAQEVKEEIQQDSLHPVEVLGSSIPNNMP